MERKQSEEVHAYDAFISYSRNDIGFARALAAALSSYKPPKGLELPRRHLRIFRDEGDLTGPEYFQAIEGYLKKSSKLIVICSPSARQSEYVNDEIQRFTELKTPQSIIPIILSGIPNNEAKDETAGELAFPEAMCAGLELPLAIDYREFNTRKDKPNKKSFTNSWYTVLANLFNVSRRAIEERDLKRKRQQRKIAISIVSAIMISLATLATYAWIQKLKADRQSKLALARQLAAQAELVRDRSPNQLETSALLAIEAMKQIDELETVDREIDQLLRQAIALLPEPASPDFSVLAIGTAAFSPDGETFVGVSEDRIIRSWNSKSWEPRHWDILLSSPKFTREGGLLLGLASKTTASIWNLQSNEEIKSVSLKHGEIIKAISTDGDHLVTVDQSNQKMPSNRNIQMMTGRLGHRQGMLKAYEGRSDTEAWILSTSLGIPRVRLPHGAIVTLAAFSQDGSKIATGGSLGWVGVWETQGGEQKEWLETINTQFRSSRAAELSSLTFSPTGEHLAATSNKGLWIWSLPSGKQVQLPRRPISESPLAFSHDGNLVASGDADGTVRIWDLKTAKESVRLPHEGGLKGVVFNPEGNFLATAANNGKLQIWDVDTGNEINRTMDSGRLVGFSPDGMYLATTNRVWKIGGALDRRRILHREAVFDMSLSHDGTWIATASGSYDIRVWNVETGREARHLGRSIGETLSFSPDSGRLALGSRILHWRNDPVVEASALPHEGYVNAVAFTPDGSHLAVGEDRRVSIWRLADEEMIASLVHRSHIQSVEFTRDGSKLATSDGYTIRVWRWKDNTDNPAARLDAAGTEKFFGIAWSPDGERLAFAGRPVSARIWDPFADEIIFETPLRFGISHDVAYSSDGGYIATGSIDGYLRVWEIETGILAAEMPAHSEAIRRVDFDPYGGHLFSASLDGTVGLWPWRPKELIEYSCLQLPRNLSESEWSQFLKDNEYKLTCGPDKEESPQASISEAGKDESDPEGTATNKTALPIIPKGRVEAHDSFLMAVEDVFLHKGKLLVTGRIERGQLAVGDELEVVGCIAGICPGSVGIAAGEQPRVVVTIVAAIEQFRKEVGAATAGDNIGILLQGINKDRVKRGQVLATPGSIIAHNRFKAEAYVLSREEGGRHTPFFNGYRPQFYFRTTDVTGVLKLPSEREMVMPGEHVSFSVELSEPIAIEKGTKFVIREGGRTVGRGAVSEILQ